MDLDARHPLAHRRGVVVGHAERGRPDQHQPAPEAARLDAPAEDVRGRQEARRILTAVVQPCPAVGLGADDEVAHRDRLDPARAHAYRERRRTRGHPQHLDAEGRGERAAQRGEQRHAADHAALGIHVDEPAPCRGGVDLLHAPQRAREARHERRRIAAEGAHRRLAETARRGAARRPRVRPRPAPPAGRGARRRARCRCGAGRASFRTISRSRPARSSGSRSGESRSGSGMRMSRPMAAGRASAIRPTRRASQRTRPGPLAIAAQALLVDGDDDDRCRLAHTRGQALVGVEGGQAQQPEPRHVREQDQDDEQGQQQDARRAGRARRGARAPTAALPSAGARARDARGPTRRRSGGRPQSAISSPS